MASFTRPQEAVFVESEYTMKLIQKLKDWPQRKKRSLHFELNLT